MFTSVAFAELPAQQGWLYQWDEQSFASLHDVETEMRARPNGRDHQLAFPDGLTTSSNNLEIVRLDYRVAGTLDIGSTRPPMAQVYELYGGLTPGGTFFSAAGCAGQPTGWCTSETAFRANWVAYQQAHGCALVANPAPTGSYSTTPLYLLESEYPLSTALHGAGLDYRGGNRTWTPSFQCTVDGHVFPLNETFVLVRREHYFCPEHWRLSRGVISLPGNTLAEKLPNACIAQAGGAESADASGQYPVASRATPVTDKEGIGGAPRDAAPKCPVGNPCSPITGKKTAVEHDFTFAGIAFNRYYDSVAESRDYGNLSLGWSHSFSDRVLSDHLVANHTGASCTSAHLQTENGSIDLFTGSGPMYSADNREEVLQCISTAPISWMLARPDGSQRIYNADGYPVEIRYPDAPQGNLTLTWAKENGAPVQGVTREYAPRRLLRVENAVGRALVFNYYTDGDHRLRSISDHAGNTLVDYEYTNVGVPPLPPGQSQRTYAIGDLLEARTSGSIRRYQYDYRHLLTNIQEVGASGSVVDYASYSYDSAGRAQSTQHAGGAGLHTFSYTADGSVGTAILDSGATATFTQDGSRFRRPLTASAGTGAHRRASTFTYDSGTGRALTRTVRINDGASTTTRNVFANNDWVRPAAVIEAEGTMEERATRYVWNLQRNLPTSTSVERCNRSAIGQSCSPVIESIERRAYNSGQQLTAVCLVDPLLPAAVAYTCGSAQHAPVGVRQTRFDYCATADATASCPFTGWLRSVDGPRTDVLDVTTYEYRTQSFASCSTNFNNCAYRKGDLYAVVNALNQRTEVLSYDVAGRALQVRDANATLTDFTWHPRGWQLSTTVRANANGTPSSLDAVSTATYERFGKLRRNTSPDGDYVEYCYDGAERVTAVVLNPGTCNGTATPSGGDAILFTLRADGRRTVERTVDASGTLFRRLSRQFDNLGLLTTQRDARDEITQLALTAPDTLDPAKGRRVAAFAYDGRGLRVGMEDGRQLLAGNDPLSFAGRSTDSTLDALGRVLAVADAQGLDSAPGDRGVTQYQYDARDHIVQVIDPNKLVTRYTYNGLGDLTRLDSPDTGSTIYTHDAAGNEISKTDARGVQTLSNYDVLNRLTQTTYAGGTATNPGANSYTYDLPNASTGCSSAGTTASFPIGQLSRMTDPSGVTTYCHDRRGNLLRKSQVDITFSATATEVIYTYTKADRVASITYPSGARVDYSRNVEGQISVINRTEAGITTAVVTSANYLPAGPLSNLTFGNNESLFKVRDLNYLPTDIAFGSGYGLTMETDVLGNVTRIVQNTNGNIQTQRYAYDPRYRLKAVRTDAETAIEQYTYDLTGNRLSKKFGTQTAQDYNYDNAPAAPVLPGDPEYATYSHRLDWVGTKSLGRSYDGNGNTVSAASLNGYGARTGLIYDARNRNTVTLWMGIGESDKFMQYNGLGERTTRLQTNNAGGTRSHYYRDEAGQVLGRYDLPVSTGGTDKQLAKAIPANVAYQEYIWLDDMPVAVFDKAASGATQLAFIGTDHLNTPRIARVGGNDVWRWDLVAGDVGTGAKVAAFGEAQPQLQILNIELRFPGQVYDAVSGLHYNYFRDYEPATGRYTQSDPIGLAGGLSTYGYVGGNPLSQIDPLGLEGSGVGYTPSQLGQLGEEHGRTFRQQGSAAASFARNYRDMRRANTIGADKYFHCKANCEAAQAGPAGADMACLISDLREDFDQWKGDPPSASAADQVANHLGRANSGKGICRQGCAMFRPPGLDPQY